MNSQRYDETTADTSAIDDGEDTSAGEARPDRPAGPPRLRVMGGGGSNGAPRLPDDGEPSPSRRAAPCSLCGSQEDGLPCGGFGYVRKDVPLGHPDFGRALVCPRRLDEVAMARTSELRTASNMAAMAEMTFGAFQLAPYPMNDKMRQSLKAAFDAAREFAAEPRGWLVFSGTFGSGKTQLAAAIANERLASGRAALFVVVPDLLDHLRATYSPGSEVSYDERFEAVRTAPVLILDDLGAQSSTPWATEKLFQILNYRYTAQLPTVITTNQRMEDIEERLRSRLQDGALVRHVHISAPDYRRSGMDRLGGDLSTLRLHGEETFESFDLRQNELLSQGQAEAADSLKRAFDAARKYAEDPRGWLVLTGRYGSGKTHLAAAIANERIGLGDAALFVYVPDLLDHLRATFSPQSNVSYDRRFEEVRNVPFLVLDDLSLESATPWAREKLFQIINHRYAARLPTVITTSTKEDEMDERLKARIYDFRRCVVIAILAPSYHGGKRSASASSAPAPRRRATGR